MPKKDEGVPMSDNDIYVWDMYQETPVMSTYNLAFVISSFTYKQSEARSNGVQFRTWSRKSVADQMDLAAELGPQILEFFENHLNVSYPLPKMDMIAIPDFSYGAMENWGLITFQESSLLYNVGQNAESDKDNLIQTIAHEMAHQWFGNLVTSNWWSE